ncbi:MAG: addiction module antidote protein, HigA family [Proteobacteria bacterium]|nr:MAG: addiction module antidote protein, HigA family [Pseudomonadota bacterium]PIE40536.1 MAG: addiction module antidote protein, HigA family [Gammaproteobacteria bacterium]
MSLSEIVNARRGVSPKMAIKLAKAFGGSAKSWLGMQMAYDLWQAEQEYTADDMQAFEPAV